jgi:hypothetical protein
MKKLTVILLFLSGLSQAQTLPDGDRIVGDTLISFVQSGPDTGGINRAYSVKFTNQTVMLGVSCFIERADNRVFEGILLTPGNSILLRNADPNLKKADGSIVSFIQVNCI